MVGDSGLSLREVANRLSIPESSLRYLVKKSQEVKLLETTKNSKNVTADEMELSRLRRELSELKAERDILKKVAAYFAKGDCYDNAPMESFWGTLKNELVSHRKYRSKQEAIIEITEYTELFYNRQRIQAKLDYLSPIGYLTKYYEKLKYGIA
jgi:transposase-like protein